MEAARTFWLTVIVMLPALTGCNGAWNGEPDFQQGILLPVSPDTPKVVQDATPDVCKDLLQAVPGTAINVPARNGCIFAVMSEVDQAFYEYRKALHGLVDNGNAVTDIASIGISSAGALVPGATTKTILAVINTGLAGAKAKINSDVLYSNSITLILTQMDADRADWKSRILAQINDAQKSGGYTMYQAATDLLSYYEAGTWDHALTSLATQASSNLNNCQAAVKSAQTTNGTNTAAPCGPQSPQVVTVVPSAVQQHREALAAYIKTLSTADVGKLAQALLVPTGTDPLVGSLQVLDNASTADQVNAIAATIKILFGKDI